MLLLFFRNNPTPPFWAPAPTAARDWSSVAPDTAIWTPVPPASTTWTKV
jgi:hypothetical protein